jgi:hypothetical protein
MREREYQAAKRRYARGLDPSPARRVTCETPGCGKDVAVYVPRKGDGSCEVLRRHKNPSGQWCFGSCCELPSEERAFWDARP